MCMQSPYILAAQLLQEVHLSWFDAVRIIKNIADIKTQHLPDASLNAYEETYIYFLGVREYKRKKMSVSLEEAFSLYKESKLNRRKRTQTECSLYLKRALGGLPRGWQGLVREVSREECAAMLNNEFTTPSTRNKARRLLLGFFNFALKQKWCSENPVDSISLEYVKEKRIEVLSMVQVHALLSVLRSSRFQPCLAAVAMMLWGGIRPFEVARLCWQDVDLKEKVIYLEPRHSKTGGARHVTIHAVLYRFLKYAYANRKPLPEHHITPPGWSRHWKALRQAAGFRQWLPDTLRHTYASYHLKYFKNLDELQWEMGHRDKGMLLTRYLNMRRITKKDAEAFWKVPISVIYPEPTMGRKRQAVNVQQDL